jgi:hypothetical protein
VPPLKAPNSVKIVISFMMVQIFLEGLICLNKIWTQPHDPYLSCLITGEDFLMIILIWQKQFNLYHWHTKFHENSVFFLSKQFIIIMWTGICIQKFQSIAYFFTCNQTWQVWIVWLCSNFIQTYKPFKKYLYHHKWNNNFHAIGSL